MQKYGPYVALFLFVLTIVAGVHPVIAQTGIGVSPSKIDFGTLGRGDSAAQAVRVYNTGNDTAINYTIAVDSSLANTISVTPSLGTIAPKQNASVTINAHVGSDVKDGAYNGMIIVNTTATGPARGASILPALAIKTTYNVSGEGVSAAPAGISPEIAAVLIIGVLIVVTALYAHERR